MCVCGRARSVSGSMASKLSLFTGSKFQNSNLLCPRVRVCGDDGWPESAEEHVTLVLL